MYLVYKACNRVLILPNIYPEKFPADSRTRFSYKCMTKMKSPGTFLTFYKKNILPSISNLLFKYFSNYEFDGNYLSSDSIFFFIQTLHFETSLPHFQNGGFIFEKAYSWK